MITPRNFNVDNKEATSDKYHAFWCDIYRQRFPSVAEILRPVKNIVLQKQGVDTILIMEDLGVITVDEKQLYNEYPHIAFEVKHTEKQSIGSKRVALGWIDKDLRIDYIAYAFIPTKKVYILEWVLLKQAYETNKKLWYQRAVANRMNHRMIPPIENIGGYWTHNMAVPIDIVLQAMYGFNLVISTEEIAA